MKKCSIEYSTSRVMASLVRLAGKHSKRAVDKSAFTAEEQVAINMDLMDLLNSNFFDGNITGVFDGEGFRKIWDKASLALNTIRDYVLEVRVEDELRRDDLFTAVTEAYTKRGEIKPPVPVDGGGQLDIDFSADEKKSPEVKEKEEKEKEEKSPDVIPPVNDITDPVEEDLEKKHREGLQFGITGAADAAAPGKFLSVTEIVVRFLGGRDAVFQEEFFSYYKHMVAQAWINTSVTEDNTVLGYRDMRSTVEALKQGMTSDVYARFSAMMDGTYYFKKTLNDVDPPIEILKLEKEMKMDNLSSIASFEGVGTLYVHKFIKSTNGIKGRAVVFVPAEGAPSEDVIMDSLEDYVEGISNETVSGEYAPNNEVVFMANDAFSKQLKYDAIINANLESLLKHFHPGLLKSATEKYRTGFTTQESSVSAEDQDSRRIRLSKETTPRVKYTGKKHKDGTDIVEQSSLDPYLTAQDFNVVSQQMVNNSSSKEKLMAFLEQKMIGKDTHAEIYSSIYYRFFSEADYHINEFNPITSTYEEVKHRSIESIAKKHGYKPATKEAFNKRSAATLTQSLLNVDEGYKNEKLNNVIASMVSSLKSNVPFERVAYEGNEAHISNTRGGDAKRRYHDEFMSRISRPGKIVNGATSEETYVLHPEIPVALKARGVTRKKGSNAAGESIVTITIRTAEDENLTIELKDNYNPNSNKGIPWTVTKINTATAALTLGEMKSIFQNLGLPKIFFDKAVYENIQKEFGANTQDTEFHGDLPVLNFFSNVLNEILIIRENKSTFKVPLVGETNSPLWGFDSIMTEVFAPIYGSGAKQFIRSYTNEKLAVQAPVSKVRKFHNLVHIARNSSRRNVNIGSYIVGDTFSPSKKAVIGDPEKGVGGIYSKMGFRHKNIIKGNFDMTPLENIDFLSLRAFYGRLKSSNFQNALIQVGAMSDRTDIPLIDVRGNIEESADGRGAGYMVFPKTSKNALDRDLLKLQWVRSNRAHMRQTEGAILSAWRPILTKLGYDIPLRNINDLSNFLKANDIPYDVISKETSLVKNVQLSKRAGEFADIPSGLISTINIFQSTHEGPLLEKWNNAIQLYNTGAPHLETLEQLEYFLAEEGLENDSWIEAMYAGIPSDIRKEMGMEMEAFGKVSINKALTNKIKNLEGNTLATQYLEDMRLQFYAHLKESGFTQDNVDKNIIFGLKEEIKGEFSTGNAKLRAFNAIMDAYFYNQSTLGQEALRIYTGGTFQYKAKPDVIGEGKVSYFNLQSSTEPNGILTPAGKIDTRKVLSTAKNAIKLGKDWKPGETSTAALPGVEVLVKKYDASHRWVWMAQVLKSDLSKAEQARILVMDDIGTMTKDSFIDQVKRNAAVGTTGQSPTIVSNGDYGLKLTSHSKNVTFSDPKQKLKIAGVPLSQSLDIYDAVQMGHPLYFLKLNNSLGNEESNFSFHGTPVKDITNGITKDGYAIYQKKATFNIFDNEILTKGTPELEHLFKRMNTTIIFGNGAGVDIMVPKTDVNGEMIGKTTDSYTTPVDIDMWIKNGVALGALLDTETGEMVSAETLLTELRRNELTERDFRQALETKRYRTNRESRHFNNLQELWEHFGATNNKDAWKDVGFIIGNYYGGITSNNTATTKALKLRTEGESYPLRDSYIEKAGLETQEKTGNQNLMNGDDLVNPFDNDSGFLNADGTPRYYPVSNEGHLVILQAEHETDTTAKSNAAKLGLAVDENLDDNTVALITQIINANIEQGRSVEESKRIGKSLANLSEVMVTAIKNDMKYTAIEIATAAGVTGPQLELFEDYFTDFSKISKSDVKKHKEFKEKYAEIDPYLKKAFRITAKDMMIKALNTQEDPGVVGELLDMSQGAEDFLSFDLKQIQPLAQSIIFSRFNREGVRYRFAGGQFVVAPSEHFIRTYSIGKVSNYTRKEYNDRVYSLSPEALNAAGLSEESMTAELLKFHTLNDKITINVSIPSSSIVKGETMTVYEARRAIKEIYDSSTSPVTTFEKYFENMAVGHFGTRLGKLGSIEAGKGGNRLQWARYINKDGVELKETDNFISYQLSEFIPKSHVDIVKSTDTVGNEGATGEKFFYEEGAGTIVVPKALTRAYFFSEEIAVTYDTGSSPAIRAAKAKVLADFDPIALGREVSPEWESKFEAWYEAQQADEVSLALLANSVYNFTVLRGKDYTKSLRIEVEHTLSDKAQNWVTKPAEFYLPSMHKAAFLIRNEDTMHTFFKDGEVADKDTLVSAGIFSPAEVWDIDKNFKTKEISDKIAAKINSGDLTAEQIEVLDGYRKLKRKNLLDLGQLYNGRIREFLRETKLFDVTSTIEKAIEQNRSVIDAVIGQAMYQRSRVAYGTSKSINRKEVQGSALYTAWNDIVVRLTELKTTLGKDADEIALRWEISKVLGVNDVVGKPPSPVDTFIVTRANSLANNFNASLEFITARIPAQGKQSYMYGKIKNFINSTKNSVYGPLEMLIINGADYDIDKQSMMTWAVDNDGTVVDWKAYTLSGTLEEVPNIGKLEARVKKGRAEITATFKGDTSPSAKKLLQTAIKRFEQEEYENFAKATQNTVVFNLIQTVQDPKNALEAATPVTTNTVKSTAAKADYTQLKGSDAPATFLAAREHAFSQNPASMMIYEAVNGAGKSGIGIYAADLKAYTTVYAAVLDSGSDEEIENIVLSSQFGRLPTDARKSVNKLSSINAYLESIGVSDRIEPDAIQFIKFDKDRNPIIQNITTLANVGTLDVVTDKEGNKTHTLTTYTEASAKAKELRDKIKGMRSEAEQEAAIFEYIEELGAFDSMLVEPQAWSDLSELLTAATDNAKELILGKIGANNTTNSIISTMIRMGVPLKDAIGLIQEITNYGKSKPGELLGRKKEEEVRNIFNSVIKHKDVRYIRKPGETTYSSVAQAIKAILPKSPSSVSPKVLLEHPLYRLLPFVEIQEEFSIWTKLVGINQGLKVREHDVWAWVAGIEQSITSMVKDNEIPPKEPPYKFDLELFVKEAKNKGMNGSPYVREMIGRYNSIKKGVNIPFILYKSDHFFSYILALYDAKNTMAQVSEIAEINTRVLNASIDAIGMKVGQIREIDSGRLRNYIHGIGIDMFFKGITTDKDGRTAINQEAAEDGKIYDLYGRNYDLSNIETTKDSNGKEFRGRQAFIEDMPNVLEDAVLDMEKKGLSENSFITSLRNSHEELDYVTQRPIVILKGQDVKKISLNRRAELQLGANLLITDAPVLHKALFAYSLITNKGQYGGGSFASLLGADNFRKYSLYLRDNIDLISQEVEEGAIGNFNDPKYLRLILNNPALIKTVTTTSVEGEKELTKFIERDDKKMRKILSETEDGVKILEAMDEERANNLIDAQADQGNEDADARDGERAPRHKGWDTYGVGYYYLGHVRYKKLRDTEDHYPPVIRSKDNNLVYKWSASLTMWIPFVQTKSSSIIPYESGRLTKASDITGFTEGWEIENGNKSITLLGFVDSYLEEDLIAGEVPAFEGKKVKKAGSKEAKGDYAVLQPNVDYYIIKQDGEYKIWDAAHIKNFVDTAKNDLLLNGPKMGLVHSVGERTPDTTVKRRYFEEVDSSGKYKKLHTTSGVNNEHIPITVQIEPLNIASDSTVAIYDKAYFNAMADKLKSTKAVDMEHTSLAVSVKYERLRDTLLMQEMRDNPNFSGRTDSMLRAVIAKAERGNARIVKQIEEKVEEVFPIRASLSQKIEGLYSAKEMFEAHFQLRSLENPMWEQEVDELNLPKRGTLLQATIEMLETGNNLSAMSMKGMKDFFHSIGGTNFDAYIKSVMLKPGNYMLYEKADGTVITKGRLKRGKQLIEELQPLDIKTGSNIQEQKVFINSDARMNVETKASRKVFKKLVAKLNKLFPGTSYRMSDTKSIEAKYGIKDASNVRAFVKDGTVVFNMDIVNMNTPFHEYSHIYFEYLKVEDRPLYDKLIKLALESPLYAEMKDAYGTLNNEDLGEEILAEQVARKMKGKLIEDPTFTKIENVLAAGGRFGKIKRWFKSLFDKVFGINKDRDVVKYKLSMNDSFNTMIEKIGDKMAYGDTSILSEFLPSTIKMVALSREGSQINIKEARQILEDAGFIQRVCV